MLSGPEVSKLILKCLYKNREDIGEDAVRVRGIVTEFVFDPVQLKRYKGDIIGLLDELPEEFAADRGGGYSFLNACMTRLGVQWGEQRNVEDLMCLGIAIKRVRYCLDRDMWEHLPGGVPYFVYNVEEDFPDAQPETQEQAQESSKDARQP